MVAQGLAKHSQRKGWPEIAEKTLFRFTCGDIGTEPDQVETYLDSVFNLGKIWDCVVLLDEADVFQRNALVSVFLRVLEYNVGIHILTSNRVGTFDEAFQIPYPAGPALRKPDRRLDRKRFGATSLPDSEALTPAVSSSTTLWTTSMSLSRRT